MPCDKAFDSADDFMAHGLANNSG